MLCAMDRALGNYVEAREVYRRLLRPHANRQQQRPGEIPDWREIQRLNDQERFKIQNVEYRRAGRPQIYWRSEEHIIALAVILTHGRIANRVGIYDGTPHIMRRRHPYRVQQVQTLQPGSHRARRNFCR